MTAKALVIAAGAAAILTQIAVPDAAHASKGRGKDVFERHYVTPGPVKGHTGFVGGYFCDYKRVPNRKCVVMASGKERCLIVNWTLTQACY